MPASPRISSSGAAVAWAQKFASTEARHPPRSSSMSCQLSSTSTGTRRPAAGPSATTNASRVRELSAVTRATGPTRPAMAASGYTAMSTSGPPAAEKNGEGSDA